MSAMEARAYALKSKLSRTGSGISRNPLLRPSKVSAWAAASSTLWPVICGLPLKSCINRGTEMDLESAALFEIDCFGLCFSTEEQKKGMEAFVNKKK